jgi:hypothetical protein
VGVFDLKSEISNSKSNKPPPSPGVPEEGAEIAATNNPSDLPTILRRNLAWASIDEFRFVQAIPLDKRHNAKVDYPALKRMLQ